MAYKPEGPPYEPIPPGVWPTFEIEWEDEVRTIPFTWCTFDVYPEMWSLIEQRRIDRETRIAEKLKVAH